MNLPWCSRLAYDAVLARAERAEAQVDRLLDDLTRVVRTEAGLPETAPVVKPPDPMPPSIVRMLRSFSTPTVRDAERAGVLQRHADGEPWESIEAEMVRKYYGPDYEPEEEGTSP